MTQNSEVSDDMLMALADGELNHRDSARLMARMSSDPDIAERYAVFAETRALMQQAFKQGPVPERLLRAVLDAPPAQAAAEAPRAESAAVVPFARRVAARPGRALALAASLVLAVGLGGFLAGRGSAPLLLAEDPGLSAARALARTPTGGEAVLPGGATARALASFQTDLGLCRLISTANSRSIACRTDAGWAVALTVTGTEGAGFLPASDLGTALIDRLLDDIGAGQPLDLQDETRALAP